MGEEEEEEEEEVEEAVGGLAGRESEDPELQKAAGAKASDNPLSDFFDVTVSTPETLEIKMVDATVLSDYEVWSFIASFLGAVVVGFGVAYLQATKNVTLLATTVVFLVLFGVAVRMAYAKRKRLAAKSKTIRLRQ